MEIYFFLQKKKQKLNWKNGGCEMSKEEMICDITGEYCENAGSDYCIDCSEFTVWAIGDEW